MSMKEQLNQSLKEAIRAKDEVRKRTIRMALATIKNAEIEQQAELDEPAILGILQKEVGKRQETIEDAQRAGREDMIASQEAEIEILEEFLPKPLTQDELEDLVQEVIEEVGASSPREMGQVMKNLMPRIRGRADGQEASQIVRRLLS
jgi:uncharacterized protein YqeY